MRSESMLRNGVRPIRASARSSRQGKSGARGIRIAGGARSTICNFRQHRAEHHIHGPENMALADPALSSASDTSASSAWTEVEPDIERLASCRSRFDNDPASRRRLYVARSIGVDG
jgi:hypothetical protein